MDLGLLTSLSLVVPDILSVSEVKFPQVPKYRLRQDVYTIMQISRADVSLIDNFSHDKVYIYLKYLSEITFEWNYGKQSL